jgi:hypothetical protein
VVGCSKYFSFCKIILEMLTGNVVITEVEALTYVLLSKVENHVFCEELVGTIKHMTSQTRCRTHQGHFNRVQLIE